MPVSSREDLFGLDPADFVAERDALAKQLRAGGASAEAAEIKTLRRPSVPVWALNQVARRNTRTIDAFLDASGVARRAQAEVFAGKDATVLRDAMSKRRRALDAVATAAREVIDASGRSAATYEREIDAVLAAVAASGAHNDELRRGELVAVSAEQADEDVFAQLAASVPTAKTPKSKPKTDSAQLRKARERLEHDREAARAAEQTFKDAQTALAAAQRAADAAERAFERARHAVGRSEDAVTRLER